MFNSLLRRSRRSSAWALVLGQRRAGRLGAVVVAEHGSDAAKADVPAFAHLPHFGRLDGLFFRIFKTGVELPLAGVKEEDLDCVCEGGENCLAYLYRQRDGKTLVSLGFDVYADLPEAKALLDGLIESLETGD